MIDLHYWTTPNGHKITLFLEEAGLPYAIKPVNIGKGDQFRPDFLAISPNNRIPAIVDHAPADGGRPIPVFESGAILLYLAEKSGKLMPADKAGYYEVLQWVMFQMSFIGPMFGQVGFFNKFAGRLFEDKRPLNHYVDQSKNLLALLDERLESRAWMMGDNYTIVDISVFPWVRNLIGYYKAADLVGISNFPNVMRALDVFLARPAVARGLKIPAAD
jgi:GST-like protein